MAGLYAHIKCVIALRDSKAAVVICGYRSPRNDIPTIYDAILTGDTWHCFKIADTNKKCEVVEVGEKKQRASEYVWTNRVPEHAKLYISLRDYKQKISFDEYWQTIKRLGHEGKLLQSEMHEYADAYAKLFKNKELF
jgi:hypothetical protein